MSYGIINPTEEQARAWNKLSWKDVCEVEPSFTSLFNGDNRDLRLQRFTEFSDQSVATLGSLNDFDRKKILEEVISLTRNNKSHGTKSHWRNPLNRFIKSRYPFGHYHFLINYEVGSSGKIIVKEIFFDDDLTGPKDVESQERPMLYHVDRLNGAKYEKPITLAQSNNLRDSWSLDAPVYQVSTEFAAVNGMLNDLDKAAWLMGVHLDNAYRNANPKSYTLYHNPTEGWFVDLIECLWDKSPVPTHNAAKLSAILKQNQTLGRKTRWIVHSQGAIVFNSAVAFHNRNFGTPLNCHSVAIHAPGAAINKMRENLGKSGIEIIRVRQNPFDLVPNVAGTNNLSTSGLRRSLQFMGLIFRNNSGNSAISPHTLPYLGIRTYQKQLEMTGFTKKAKKVKQYIEKRNADRRKRRGR